MQEAFNSIEVEKMHGIDYTLAKVQSIANFYNMEVINSTKEHQYIPLNDSIKDLLKTQATNMLYGVHFLRYIAWSNNEKLEKYGHSMVLIKEPQGSFFYDPNFGVELIKDKIADRLNYHLHVNQERFKIDRFRFYTLSEKRLITKGLM